jgi:cation-transporting P-type ATPase C
MRKISIRHAMPGRVRLGLAALRLEEALADRIEALGGVPGVAFARVNRKAACCVLRYDPAVLAEAEAVALVHGAAHDPEDRCGLPALAARPELHAACASPLCDREGCKATQAGCEPVRPALRRFALLSAVMGGVLVRTTVLGLGVAQTALSPLGLLALGASLPLVRKAARQARRGRFSLETLLGASCVAAVAAGEALTAFEVLWINSGAELLKAWITERSRRSIAGILAVTSHHTFVLVDGVEVEAEVASLKPGDVVVLHTGEKVCVDGEIVDGHALMDESPITGRADFVPRERGARVLAGTFVREGVIYVRADEVGDRTYLSRVLRLVEDSLENRAPIEGVADRLAANLVRVGFVVTAGTLVITGSLWRAFTVLLVMACPCATVLAASTAVSAALSAAAKRNILIKGGRYLEEIGSMDTVCFDKTGTLTSTEPALERVVPLGALAEAELLRLAVSVETHNHHPLAQAVRAEAARRGVEPMPHEVCDYHLGRGVRAELGGAEVLVGNHKLLDEHGLRVSGAASRVEPLRRRGLTVLYVALKGELVGLLAFENQPRPEGREVVETLRRHGAHRVVLITGDEERTTRELCARLDLDEYHASVLPERKAEIVRAMRAAGRRVLMVGDGINDALALAAADIALVNDDLRGLVYVRELSRATLAVVHQNFWIATGSNLLGVVLGATGLLSPVMAGLLHVAHSAGVLANSSRLLGFAGSGPASALAEPSLEEPDPEDTERAHA